MRRLARYVDQNIYFAIVSDEVLLKLILALIFSMMTLVSVSNVGPGCIGKSNSLNLELPSFENLDYATQLTHQEDKDQAMSHQDQSDCHICHIGHCDFAINPSLNFNFNLGSVNNFSKLSSIVIFDFQSGLFRPPIV